MSHLITHEGIITAINNHWATVQIVQLSACSACHAKMVCNPSESKEKSVEVSLENQEQYCVGDKVVLVGESSQSRVAVLVAYVIPLVVLVMSMLIASWVGYGELISAFWSLGATAIYFMLLSLFRNRLKRILVFRLRKLNE